MNQGLPFQSSCYPVARELVAVFEAIESQAVHAPAACSELIPVAVYRLIVGLVGTNLGAQMRLGDLNAKILRGMQGAV